MTRIHVALLALCLSASACLTKKPINNDSQAGIKQNLKEIKVNPNKKLVYRATPTQEWQISLTELDIKLNFKEHQANGTVTHFVTQSHKITDTLTLDAKSMTILNVFKGANREIIPYLYDEKKLYIPLKTNKEEIIAIDFIAKPDEYKGKGSSAISDARGLYFINTSKTDSLKPTQVWTQGETEGNSVWFPTIDKPNHKMKFKIRATFPKEYDMLSNGVLTDKKIIGDQAVYTWEQNKPMSAYLVMMAIGKFHTHREQNTKLPIAYWVEPPYAKVADKIFDKTPEMIRYFESKLGTPFPWDKYDQVVVRDYVSGAMENTSASLFGEFVQKHGPELIDNGNEGIVAHELFHQWFGDLVTCESWSNLFLNEGFASFGELLWAESKSGQEAEMIAYSDLKRYLDYAAASNDPIVNFYYNDKEDMFNTLTYRKGSRVLNLLRSELGEDVFFTGIKKYLSTYQYNSAEVHDFRKIMEEASGRDLNTFFNQWIYKGGYPSLEMRYTLDNQNLIIFYNQKNKDSKFVYQFPLALKLINPDTKKFTTHKFYVNKLSDSIIINQVGSKMPIIIVDHEHNCLADIKEIKSDEEKLNTLLNTSSYYEAARIIDQTDSNTDKTIFNQMIAHLLKSETTELVKLGLRNLPEKNNPFTDQLINLADHKNARIRETALQELAANPQDKNIPIALNKLNDPSWLVQAAAIQCLHKSKYKDIDQIVQQNYYSPSAHIVRAVSPIIVKRNNIADSSFYQYHLPRSQGFTRNQLMYHFMKSAVLSKNIQYIQNTWNHLAYYAKEMESIEDRSNAVSTLAASWNTLEDKSKLTEVFERLKSKLMEAEKNEEVLKEWKTDRKFNLL